VEVVETVAQAVAVLMVTLVAGAAALAVTVETVVTVACITLLLLRPGPVEVVQVHTVLTLSRAQSHGAVVVLVFKAKVLLDRVLVL
jgi:enoyl reductase-like protein